VTFSHRQHTKAQTRSVVTNNTTLCNLLTVFLGVDIVRYVSGSMRPFTIVIERGFQSLMKTGRPMYYIPSASTVSRDVKEVFIKVRAKVANMLQVKPKSAT